MATSDKIALQRFRAGEWLVDPSSDRIRDEHGWTSIRPKVMDMLVLLAHHPRRIFTVEELLEGIWPNTVTSPASVYNCLKELRAVLRDDPHAPRYIETFPKRGYRFIAPVEFADSPGAHAQSAQPGSAGAQEGQNRESVSRLTRLASLALILIAAVVVIWLVKHRQTPPEDNLLISQQTEFTTVAVLPFTGHTADGSDRNIGDGLALEIYDEISMIPGFRALSPNSSFRFRASDESRANIGSLLDADLVVGGAVFQSGRELTVEAYLTDVRSGEDVWARTLQVPVNDLFLVHTRLGEEVRTALNPENQDADSTSAHFRQPAMMVSQSYEAFLEARSLVQKADKESLLSALAALDEVIGHEPVSGRAKALRLDARWRLYYLHEETWPQGQVNDLDSHIEYQQALLEESEQLVREYPLLSEAHLLLGRNLRFTRSYDSAHTALQRALELNPSLGEAHSELGWLVFNRYESWANAVNHFRQAVALDPYSPELRSALVRALSNIADQRKEMWSTLQESKERLPWSANISLSEGVALVSEGRYADAIRVLEDALEREKDRRIRNALAEKWYALDRPDRSREIAPNFESWRDYPEKESPDSINRCPAEAQRVQTELLSWAAYVCAAMREPRMTMDLLLRGSNKAGDMKSDPQGILGTEYSPAIMMAWAYRSLGELELAEKYARIEEQVVDGRSDNGGLRSAEHAMLRARVSAALGESAQVIALLGEMLDFGRIDPRALDHPIFDEYRDLQAFRKIENQRATLVQAQLARLGLTPPGSG